MKVNCRKTLRKQRIHGQIQERAEQFRRTRMRLVEALKTAYGPMWERAITLAECKVTRSFTFDFQGISGGLIQRIRRAIMRAIGYVKGARFAQNTVSLA